MGGIDWGRSIKGFGAGMENLAEGLVAAEKIKLWKLQNQRMRNAIKAEEEISQEIQSLTDEPEQDISQMSASEDGIDMPKIPGLTKQIKSLKKAEEIYMKYGIVDKATAIMEKRFDHANKLMTVGANALKGKDPSTKKMGKFILYNAANAMSDYFGISSEDLTKILWGANSGEEDTNKSFSEFSKNIMGITTDMEAGLLTAQQGRKRLQEEVSKLTSDVWDVHGKTLPSLIDVAKGSIKEKEGLEKEARKPKIPGKVEYVTDQGRGAKRVTEIYREEGVVERHEAPAFAPEKPEKPPKPTITDARAVYATEMEDIRTELSILAKSEGEANQIQSSTPDQAIAMFLAGKLKSIPKADAERLLKRTKQAKAEFRKLAGEVLGRKGIKLDEETELTPEKKVDQSRHNEVMKKHPGAKFTGEHTKDGKEIWIINGKRGTIEYK